VAGDDFQAELSAVRNLWRVAVNPSTLQWETLDRLTTGPGPDTSLALSRDGKKLAFTSGKEQIRVWSYHFDARVGRVMGKGEPVTPLGVDAWEPDISPDGTKLAYFVRRSGKWELWSKHVPNGSQTLLGEGAHPGGDHARWSPDSNALLNGAWNSDLSHCIVREEDGSSQPITSPRRSPDCVDWLPDGRSIIGIYYDEHSQSVAIQLLPLSSAPRAEHRALPQLR
jgi:dipeptidyl aminopeptidase/acylaminoacyl peptidase